MKEANRLRNIEKMLSLLKVEQPIVPQLKTYFREHPQWGSRDRKLATEATLAWARCGNAMPVDKYKERIGAGMWLSGSTQNEFFTANYPQYSLEMESFDEKLQWLKDQEQFDVDEIFPFRTHLEYPILEAIKPLFRKQDFFIRIPHSMASEMENYFQAREIPLFRHPTIPGCYRLDSGTKLDEIRPDIRSQIIIQDSATQALTPIFSELKANVIWDACAASGGKSLLYAPLHPQTHLYVSDIRTSIIENLHHRFKSVGIKKYHHGIADLEKRPEAHLTFQEAGSGKKTTAKPGFFDGIILDAPCSGSGTWRHHPERLLVKEPGIEFYANRQDILCKNVLPFLAPGGFLVYITCSVYDIENSGHIPKWTQEYSLKLEKDGYLNEWENGGDSLYFAVYRKS